MDSNGGKGSLPNSPCEVLILFLNVLLIDVRNVMSITIPLTGTSWRARPFAGGAHAALVGGVCQVTGVPDARGYGVRTVISVGTDRGDVFTSVVAI
jgi:hypothetical protein